MEIFASQGAPPVSTTPAANFSTSFASVVDTGGNYDCSVIETLVENKIAIVVLTPWQMYTVIICKNNILQRRTGTERLTKTGGMTKCSWNCEIVHWNPKIMSFKVFECPT